MSDATLDRILAQCSAFIRNPDENYMLDIFAKKFQTTENFPVQNSRL